MSVYRRQRYHLVLTCTCTTTVRQCVIRKDSPFWFQACLNPHKPMINGEIVVGGKVCFCRFCERVVEEAAQFRGNCPHCDARVKDLSSEDVPAAAEQADG